ncbi:site-specific DNA-methyltransferase [Algoriphagus formosus]|uniref:site-specific DNA-methyltransferase n=1 Tax=Algoriphagus formosus TaxID=2007308 RepID=UPI003F723D00
MPTLHWIGKEKVINHHQEVPYRVLEKQYEFNTESGYSENKIIQGDNLEALKSLLPEYEGRINCIYIDPPYNTGNENWVYNDNVNHPKIKKWLGETVGKEGEDLSRHDKWLCMMYPRLKLLHKLMAKDGVIFISIDDNEVNFLKIICDEVFGKSRFIGQLVWKSRQNKDNRNISRLSNDHEYILCYGERLNGLKRDESQFSNPDSDLRGKWVSANMVGLADEKSRPNLHYDIVDPETGITYKKPKMGWRYDKNSMAKLIEEKRIIWPSSPSGRPRKKQFISDYLEDVTGYSSIVGKGIFTKDGTNTLREIFSEKNFDFPKPAELVREILEQATSKDSIVLDSFAGSGTTAHAVLNLNKKDGGNRNFILIEMEDYADSITAERVKRVIQGYGSGTKVVEGTGGDFEFFTLGSELFDGEGNLNEKIALTDILAYIWYSETRTKWNPPVNHSDRYYLGSLEDTAYYFIYERDRLTTLDFESLSAWFTQPAEQYICYADNCLLPEALMQKHRIIFKKIPRDITRF